MTRHRCLSRRRHHHFCLLLDHPPDVSASVPRAQARGLTSWLVHQARCSAGTVRRPGTVLTLPVVLELTARPGAATLRCPSPPRSAVVVQPALMASCAASYLCNSGAVNHGRAWVRAPRRAAMVRRGSHFRKLLPSLTHRTHTVGASRCTWTTPPRRPAPAASTPLRTPGAMQGCRRCIHGRTGGVGWYRSHR